MSNYSDSHFAEDPNSSWKKIFDYIRPGSKVLDVGCSSGNFGAVLTNEKGCIVDGVELDVDDFNGAKGKLRNVYNLNIESDDLSAITDIYDYIYFGDVIEHLYTPAKSLKRVKALLSKRGELIFSIPNMSHISVRLMLLNGDFKYGETGLLDKTHLHFYTPDEVRRILGEAGFEMVYYDPVLKDLPVEIIKEELKTTGLNISDEFIDFSRKGSSSIYQIVGAAKVLDKSAKPKKLALDPSSPVDKFEGLLNETKQYYETRIKTQEKHIAKLEKYAKKLAAKYAALEETNARHVCPKPKPSVIKRISNKLRTSERD